MALQAPLSSSALPVSARHRFRGIAPSTLVVAPVVALLLTASSAAGQTPPQQYVYGSVPVTTATSQVAAYSKNSQTGALTTVPGAPFADQLQGGPMAIDGQGRFLFVINPGTSNISMFQINQGTGALTEVPGSPFSTGPTENLNMAATSPSCLAAERSGQFLYVGYRFGNFTGQGAINEYRIDSTNLQLVPLSGQPTTDIASSPIGMLSDPKGLHLYVGLGLNASTGVQDAGTNVYSIDAVTGVIVLVGMAGAAIERGRSISIDPQGRFFFDGWGLTQGGIDSALISPADGTATTGISTVNLGGSAIPSAIVTDGSGKFLYAEQGVNPVVYSINQTTGALAVPPSALSVLSFSPGSAAADPLGPYLYSLQPDGVHAFLIDPQSGALSEIPGSPFAVGTGAQGALTISAAPVQAVSGPVAALFPASENFASVTLGQTSSSQLVTLTNTGGQNLSLNAIAVTGANPGDFVATPACSVPTVLTPNATCTVSIVFSPTAAGARQANLAATDDAPGSPQMVPLSGTGVSPQPAVTFIPGSLTFATTAQGSTSPAQTITLTSAGNAALNISSVLLSGSNPGDFTLVNNGCTGALATNATCNLSVTFSPLGAGQRTASISVSDDAPNSPQSIPLTGTGQTPPQTRPAVTLSPNTISFGTVTQGATAGPQTVTLTSSGTAALHISSVVLGGVNAGDVVLTNGCTASSYAVNATCTLSVTFSPLATGPHTATLTITDDAPDSPQTIPIGANVNPAFTIAPASSGGTSVAVTAGQTAMFNLVLTPGPGFAGSVSFACTGAPLAASCSAPAVQLTGGSPMPYTVSVSTTGKATVPPLSIPPRLIPTQTWRILPLLALLFFVMILRLGKTEPWSASGRRLALAGAFAALALLATFHVSGCGGGSAAAPQIVPTPPPAPPPPPPATVTPPGTSMIVVTPAVTTASGKQLPAPAPIQLTLTVN